MALSACLSVGSQRAGEAPRHNLAWPTLGGTQLWGDVVWRADWRVQKHSLFGHYRLLDPQDVRRAWGSASACRATLDELVPPSTAGDHLVILLHGLGRSRHSLRPLEDALEGAGFAVAAIAYPSTRAPLDEHAQRLSQLLDELDGVERVSFVTHSMGGLLVRKALDLDATWKEHIEIGRVVQIAAPNQGSELARRVRDTPLASLLGPCLELVASDEVNELPRLPCEFAIIAGGKRDGAGWNPLIEGDDDGVVGVGETYLDDALDFLMVRTPHTVLMRDEHVQAAAVSFLQSGSLRVAGAPGAGAAPSKPH
jgi:pimeloyl-ACP methyl ester carboxylesterase